jgi:hypothetical protein
MGRGYDEATAREANGPVFDAGFRLISMFLGKNE